MFLEIKNDRLIYVRRWLHHYVTGVNRGTNKADMSFRCSWNLSNRYNFRRIGPEEIRQEEIAELSIIKADIAEHPHRYETGKSRRKAGTDSRESQ